MDEVENNLSDEVIIGTALDEIDKFIEKPLISMIDRHCGIINTIKKYMHEFALPEFYFLLNGLSGFFPAKKQEYTKKIDELLLHI